MTPTKEDGNVDGITQLLFWLVRLFVPPHDASPKVQLFYRWRVAGFLCCAFSISMYLFVESHGPKWVNTWIDPLVHESAFATLVDQEKRDHDATITEIHEARADAVGSKIDILRVSHCRAKDPELKQEYWNQISGLMEWYQRLVNRTYQLAPCPEIQ